MSCFDYVRYDERSMKLQEQFKQWAETMEGGIKGLPPSRASSLALTKLEEVYMWIGKAIRDAQVARGGDPQHQPARGQ